jgi:mono/diheme cytochrome c family protein
MPLEVVSMTEIKRLLVARRWVLLAGLAALPGCVGEIVDGEHARDVDVVVDMKTGGGAGTLSWWQHERGERQAELEAYLAENQEDYQWFKDAPLGSSGIPMFMIRLFPELFPVFWGGPGDHFAPVGLSEDTLEPGRVLPLGLGNTGSPVVIPGGPTYTIQVAQLTCMGCHGGRVVGPTGTVQHIVGAPNTQFNQFRLAVSKTVMHPGYSAATFRAALNAKPFGWLYGYDPAMSAQEGLERALLNSPVGDAIVNGFKARVLAGASRFAATLGAHTYANVPNPPDLYGSKPGYLDAIGAGITIIVDPALFTAEELHAILPPAPAEIDIMSVWLQADRPMAQWDGSIASKLHRNLAAEFGVVGNPAVLNMENAVRTTRFTEHLPATPYPFEVSRESAARGEELYVAYCAGCHAPGNDDLFGPDVIGTDANRADIWTPYTAGGLVLALRAGCTDAVACNAEDGSPIPSDDIALATGGYMAVPLDGIWARAPYLHNGAVPTLHALLTGERPTTFYRGNLTFDQQKVGFTWDVAGPGAALFDTTRSGLSNTGHDTAEFLGDVDWANEPQKTADLIEYMKTL